MVKTEVDFSTRCRACFSEEQEMHYLYGEFNQGLSLLKILKNVTSFDIKEDDGLSPYLCENCTTVVVDFYNFKTVYEENERYIKSLLNGDFKTVSWLIATPAYNEITVEEKTAPRNSKSDTSNADRNNDEGNLHYTNITEVLQECSQKQGIVDGNDLEITGGFIDPQDIIEQAILTEEVIIKCEGNNKIINTMKYPCKKCGILTLSKSGLQQHIQKKHNRKPVPQCYMYTSKASVKNLKVTKRSKSNTKNIKLQCSTSKEQIPSFDIQAHYKINRNYICEHCGAKFLKKSYLNDHREVHTTEKRHICPMCGKAFRRRTVLVKHKKIHTHPRQCICEICGLRFNDNGTLTTHIKLKHIKERNFHCTICGLWFPLKSTLEKHIFRHNQNRERPFICSICTMAYRDKSSLNRHVIVKHTDNVTKPSCKFCGKQYTTNTNLLKHLRRHHVSTQDFDSD